MNFSAPCAAVGSAKKRMAVGNHLFGLLTTLNVSLHFFFHQRLKPNIFFSLDGTVFLEEALYQLFLISIIKLFEVEQLGDIHRNNL